MAITLELYWRFFLLKTISELIVDAVHRAPLEEWKDTATDLVAKEQVDCSTNLSKVCNYTPTNEYGGGGVLESADEQLGSWWKVVFQSPPTVNKSPKWNLLHQLPMMCRSACHNVCEARTKGYRVMPLFRNWYIYIGGALITISDSCI